MTTEEKNRLHAIISEWEQIALKCSAVSSRHFAKGEKDDGHKQECFATARRACAQELKRMVEGGI